MTIDPPLCVFCKHYHEDGHAAPTCEAYPRGIPEEVWLGRELHLVTLPGQRGFLSFEERDDLAPEARAYVALTIFPEDEDEAPP